MSVAGELRAAAGILARGELRGGLDVADAANACGSVVLPVMTLERLERPFSRSPTLATRVYEVYEALRAARAAHGGRLPEEACAEARARLGSLAEEVARLEGEPEACGGEGGTR